MDVGGHHGRQGRRKREVSVTGLRRTPLLAGLSCSKFCTAVGIKLSYQSARRQLH